MVNMEIEFNEINEREYSLDEIIFHLEEIKMDKVCEGEYFPMLGTLDELSVLLNYFKIYT